MTDLQPLDRVLDRDADESDEAVVLQVFALRARDVSIAAVDGQPTVADLNPDYDPDASVVEVAFAPALDAALDAWRLRGDDELREAVADSPVTVYSYPAPRLRRADREVRR